MNVLINGAAAVALPYPFPKRGKSKIQITGPQGPVEAIITGGGKFPQYTYFKIDGQSHYVKGALDAGAVIEVAPATPPKQEVAEAKADQPTQPEAQAEVVPNAVANAETVPAPAKATRKTRKKLGNA